MPRNANLLLDWTSVSAEARQSTRQLWPILMLFHIASETAISAAADSLFVDIL